MDVYFSLKIELSGTNRGLKGDADLRNPKHTDHTDNLGLSVESIRLHKEIYKPGYAEIALTTSSTKDHAVIANHFFSKDSLSTLTITNSGSFIAKDYLLQNIKFKRVNEVLKVTLMAYSPDYFLTLDKSCAVYSNQKMSDIILSKMGQDIFTVGSKKYSSDSFPASRLCHTVVQSDELAEAQQKYLVQYNESFHDFMVRVANRCGEVLYYDENGYMHYGVTIPENLNELDVSNTESEMQYDFNLGYGTSRVGVVKNYIDDVFKCDSGNVVDELVTMDESLHEFCDDDDMSWKDLCDPYWPSAGAEMLKSEGLGDAVANGLQEAASVFYNGNRMLDPIDILDFSATSIKVKDEDKDSPKDGEDLFCNSFYKEIRDKELENDLTRQELSYSTCEPFMLADLYKLTNSANSDKAYMVTSVDIESVTAGITTTVVLYKVADQTTNLQNSDIYPPLYGIEHIRKSAPQQAQVTNIGDPLRLGRVQVAYPWASKASTPWIPCSTPFSGDGYSGFLMAPDKGDTVVVNYEGGNIERPYVDGSIPTTNTSPNWGDNDLVAAKLQYSGVHRAITSNGNGLTFVDGNVGQFVTGALPSIIGGPVNKFIFGKDKKLGDFGQIKTIGGGLRLSDNYGMYSISMSSASRNITIDSPWGNVAINAFTGITISAPNGDIKIEGKNITLEAGNEITLKSGKNVNTDSSKGEQFASIATSFLGGLTGSFLSNVAKEKVGVTPGKLLDLGFVRSVWEIVARPVNGGININAKCDLCLTAGEGKIIKPAAPSSADAIKPKLGLSLAPEAMIKSMFAPKEKADEKVDQSDAVVAPLFLEYSGRLKSALLDFLENLETAKSKLEAFSVFIPGNEGGGIGSIKHASFNTFDKLIESACNSMALPAVGDLLNGDVNDELIKPVMDRIYTEIQGLYEVLTQVVVKPKNFLMLNSNAEGTLLHALGQPLTAKFGLGASKKFGIADFNALAAAIVTEKILKTVNTESTVAKSLASLIQMEKSARDKMTLDMYRLLKISVAVNIAINSDKVAAKNFKKSKDEWKLDDLTSTDVATRTKAMIKFVKEADFTQNASHSTANSILSDFLGGMGLSDLASYDSDKDERSYCGSIKKLRNANGAAGPRAYSWDISSGPGSILISGDKGTTYELAKAKEHAQWKTVKPVVKSSIIF